MPSEYHYNQVDKYIVYAKLTQPMHIGNGDPEAVLIHPVTQRPFVQASGIAGVFRDYAEEEDQNTAILLFGSRKEENPAAGQLKFTDGIFCDGENRWPKMELRPHVRIDRETGSVSTGRIKGTGQRAGHRFNQEYIAAGSILYFSVYLFGRKEEKNTAGEQLLNIFSALHNGEIQFGGKKSTGCGLVKIDRLLWKHFDLASPEERKLWMVEDGLPESEYKNIMSVLAGKKDRQVAYRIKMYGRCDSLLVKCIAVPGTGQDAPDAANIQNAEKDYIVPGSSWKGVIRNRMEQIAEYLASENPEYTGMYDALLGRTFGVAGQNRMSGKAGNIRFFDAKIGDREFNDQAELQRRIHIDKFTGSVMAGSLFSEKNVSGQIVFEAEVMNRNRPEQSCGLLILALRDLALGQLNIGSGYAVGKGFIQTDCIEILKTGSHEKAVISMTNHVIQDEGHIIQECLSALREE